MKQDYFTIVDGPTVGTLSEIITRCREKFPMWMYFENESQDAQFPAPQKETTRYFKKIVEADPEYADKSANELEGKIEGITLRERLLLELQYFEETGKHLDEKSVTLCTGSRGAGGRVPNVDWSPGRRAVYVRLCPRDYRYPALRSRAAVSLDSLPLNPSHELPIELTINNILYRRV